MSVRLPKWIVAFLAAVVALIVLPVYADDPLQSVATSPAPPMSGRDKHQMEDEEKQGAAAAADIAKSSKFVTDPAVTERVNRIGQRLAAVANTIQIPAAFGNNRVYPFTWHFFVIRDKDINAFSIPGGYVYVNSGLVNFVHSDDELAAVLGHEITHSAHHHIQELTHQSGKMSTDMFLGMLAAVLAHVPAYDIAGLAGTAGYAETGIMNQKYSIPAEQDADHGGLIYMAKAGFDPVGMLTFMERLQDIERRAPDIDLGIFMDHPYTDQRVIAIRAELAEMNVAVTPAAERAVSGAPRVTVKALAPGEQQILYGPTPIVLISDPTGARAQAAADQLNDLLDIGLQIYQISSDGQSLVADDHPVLTFTPDDAALQPGATPESVAAQASNTFRSAIWDQSFNASSQTFNVSGDN